MVDEKAAGKPEVNREKQLVRLNAILWTLFFVIAFLHLIDRVYYRSDFEQKLYMISNISFSSKELELAPEEFKHSLALEIRDVPVDEISQSKAWQRLEEKTSAYSQGLSLYTQEMAKLKQRSHNRNILYNILSSVSLVGAVITLSKLKKLSKTNKAGTACSS